MHDSTRNLPHHGPSNRDEDRRAIRIAADARIEHRMDAHWEAIDVVPRVSQERRVDAERQVLASQRPALGEGVVLAIATAVG